jgi:NAD(P)-dependent dehydrogenase (short-subunit alcohol dehydrogenase family)
MEAMPSGRITTPAEVAAIVALLASPRSANVTGSNYVIDGGMGQDDLNQADARDTVSPTRGREPT